MSACANHPERAGSLAIDLPSIGVRTYLCPECKTALQAQLSGYTAYKGKREAWDHEGYDYQRFGHDLHTRTALGWRCESPTTDDRRWK